MRRIDDKDRAYKVQKYKAKWPNSCAPERDLDLYNTL